jgi:hypothetical protein
MKPSSLSPVKIEVEGDETKYVFSGSLIFSALQFFLLTFDMLVVMPKTSLACTENMLVNVPF